MAPSKMLFYSDMSRESDRVFPLVLDLTISQGCEGLYVVYVLHSAYRFRGDIVEPGLAMALNPDIVNVAERALRNRYEPLMRGYKGASFHILSGMVGVEILRFIRKHRVEQVVMACSVARASSLNGAPTLESILIERCPCPTLLVAPSRRSLALQAEPPFASGGSRVPAKVIDLDRYRTLLGQWKHDQQMMK